LTYAEAYKYLHATIPTLPQEMPVSSKIKDATGTVYRQEVPSAILRNKKMWAFTYTDNSKSLYSLVAEHELFPTIYAFNQTIYSPNSIARRSEEKLLMTTTIDFRNDTTSLRIGPYIIHGQIQYLQATQVPIANPISPCFPYGLGVERLDTPIPEGNERNVDDESDIEEVD
jgi:hypothetical protein